MTPTMKASTVQTVVMSIFSFVTVTVLLCPGVSLSTNVHSVGSVNGGDSARQNKSVPTATPA